MKRSIAVAVIAGYLGVLSWGIVSHTLSVGNVSHPGMFYIVWDMFCGWSGYESRQHLVAEGVSGNHYLLTPSPWGEFQPYGPAYRTDYDNYAVHSGKIARNVLLHTKHEPIARVYLIEESWSKRYNMPDYIWKLQFEEEKKKKSYYNTRVVYNGQCEPIQWNDTFTSIAYNRDLMADPRLARYRREAQPYYVVAPGFVAPDQLVTPASGVQTPESNRAVTIPTVPGN